MRTKSILGRKRCVWLTGHSAVHGRPRQEFETETWRREPGSRNWSRDLGVMPLTALLPKTCSVSFLTYPSSTCPGTGHYPQWAGLFPQQLLIKKTSHGAAYRPMWQRYFLKKDPSFQMILACVGIRNRHCSRWPSDQVTLTIETKQQRGRERIRWHKQTLKLYGKLYPSTLRLKVLIRSCFPSTEAGIVRWQVGASLLYISPISSHDSLRCDSLCLDGNGFTKVNSQWQEGGKMVLQVFP